ncbi:hypothetical protein Bca4012_059103 [Brassica carinata]
MHTDFIRCARTDKGVSAMGQVVSGRFSVDPPGFVDRLNANLPDQIWVFDYKRVPPSFSSYKFCDRRRYVYLIPVFALDPFAHRDRVAVMASLGSGEEYVKCFECSERGLILSNNSSALIADVKIEALTEQIRWFYRTNLNLSEGINLRLNANEAALKGREMVGMKDNASSCMEKETRSFLL